MSVLGVVQARMGSSRLPGKAMIDICGRPSLEWVATAVRASPGIDDIIIATSTEKGDDAITSWAQQKGIAVFRGSENDVLSRYLGAARAMKADVIVRTTGDCTLIDPAVIGQVVALQRMTGCDYACNTEPPTWPDGQDAECFTLDALEMANREAVRQTDRECVTRWMVRNQYRLSAKTLTCPLPNQHSERYVLDSPEDLQMIREIAKRLGDSGTPPSYLKILAILDQEPWIRKINAKFTRNERFYEALASEQNVKRDYVRSKSLLPTTETIIPLAAQTFSKSKLMFPEGAAPLFVTHGDGAYVFDVDGNDYVDCVGALLPNILGYRDPDVDAAIRDQLNRGISFSLATPAESYLAELLHKHIPSAEMVKFGKNGSDVTTAAVRLARHVTGRDRVWVGGYHGWHDWSMSVTERDAGIPTILKLLSQKVPEAGTMNWGAHPEDGSTEIPAAIILEPEFHSKANLEWVRGLCTKEGILLIFDEIISGFRCGLGGLQAKHGVTPDLSCFGKAMGNGMPISALVGLEKYMKRMPEISYSGTFFGEALSIAASIATIEKLEQEDVHGHIRDANSAIKAVFDTYVHRLGIGEYISLYGPVELNRIRFKNNGVQTLFIQEMAKNGVLIIGSFNLSLAHKQPELSRIQQALKLSLDKVKLASGSNILDHLDGALVTTAGVR